MASEDSGSDHADIGERRPLVEEARSTKSTLTGAAATIGHDDKFSEDESGPYLNGRFFALFFSRLFPSVYGAHGSIQESWDFFDRIVLPRRIKSGEHTYTKAKPGTKNSQLYPAWTTNHEDLVEFGTGITVYFETLRALVVVCFIAGLLYIPSFLYYRSDLYSSEVSNYIAGGSLRGSLICPSHEWVPCPGCPMEEWDDNPSRFAVGTALSSSVEGLGKSLTFTLKNKCAPLRWQEGVNHLVVLTFLVLAILGIGYHQGKKELQYDEAVLTSSDYSIQVDNPPAGAHDPDEWKEFFSQFGVVAYVTVAMDNQPLVQELTHRRALLRKALFKLHGHEDTEVNEIPDNLVSTQPKLYHKLIKMEEGLKELAAAKYNTSAIFVTFETELAQRKALKALSVGHINIAAKNTTALPPEYLFRGNLVLDVFESEEPSGIRWNDLDETNERKIMERIFTAFLTVLIIGGSFFLVRSAFHHDVSLAALIITLLNILMPHVFKFVNKLEHHQREDSYQASLFIKLSIFRWINTAIVTTMTKPFTVTLDGNKEALIPAVQAVLQAEIMVAPLLHMLDLAGLVKRHILAPFAVNQTAMNSYFRGSTQFLGEKYTNMTKTVFLCCFYSVIFPASFFYGAVSLGLIYVTDKFLLLRSWAPMPSLGNEVAKLSRRVFFPLTLVALAIMSEFYWSAYPYDNLCETDTVLGPDNYPEYIGIFNITRGGNPSRTEAITMEAGHEVYRFCDQDFLERLNALLAFFTEEKDDWMSQPQMMLTYIFGIFFVTSLGILTIFLLCRETKESVNQALGGFSTNERDSGERFSDQPTAHAYVPMVPHRQFSYPLIAAKISDINPRHIGWDDPIRPHEYYDLSNDLDVLMGKERPRVLGPALSVVKYFSSLERTGPSCKGEENTSPSGYGSLM